MNYNRSTKPVNKTKKLTRLMKKKLVRVFVYILLALVLLGGVLTKINAKSGEQYAAIVLNQQNYTSKTIPFKRGDILDRNGNVLATSIKVYNLILDPYIILNDEKYLEPTLTALVDNFGYTREDLLSVINSKATSRYVIQKKGLTYEEIENFVNLQNDTTNNPYIKGVWFEEEYKRQYPYSKLASSLLGFTESGNVGRWGIEEYYDDYLNGIDGREYGYVNEDNTMEPVVKEATNGDNVISTIDLKLQTICEKYIAQWVTDYNPQTVSIVMADPNNGEILAMASNKGSYDLNNPKDLSGYYTPEQIAAMSDEETITNLSKMWRNYCISDTYEPGSTFKPFTVATAIEEGKISKDQTFLCDGFEVVGSHTIHCHKLSGHGEVTVEQALMFSCNDALMQIGALVGGDLFCEYQSRFGFGIKTSIDLPGEANCAGLLYNASNIDAASLATNSFGQNFNVNMIQMVSAFSSLINGGNYYKPHVVKKIMNEDGSIVENVQKDLVKQTITKDTSDFLKTALLHTVTAGTGKTAAVDGYLVGGKTGTAQHHDKEDKNYLLSFLGFAPYDNPQVVCYVIVDSPDVPDTSSSSYACRLFSAVMTEALPYLNIFPTEQTTQENVPQETTQQETTNTEGETSQPVVPSFDEQYEQNQDVVEGDPIENPTVNQETVVNPDNPE